jgi:phosphonate transport system substrate-binding protein
MSANPTTNRPPRPSVARPLLLVFALLVIVGGVAAWFYHKEWKAVEDVDYLRNFGYGIRQANGDVLVLDPDLTDADGDLVADPPADPAKQLDPTKLTFVPLRGPRGEVGGIWDEFKAHLAKTTGKEVVYEDMPEPIALRRLLREGKLHVIGVNTGGVPAAVNAGFVPVCVPAGPDGTFGYEMEFLVPADSPVKSPKDLKGKSMKLTEASSHSGFKAALVVLKKDAELHPGRDVAISVSGSHDASIRMLANKQCDSVSVASDLLKRAEANGVIKPGQYRSIYKSAKFPPAAYGYVYNLKPDLAAKVRDAFLKFDWKGTGLEKSLGPAGQAKFVPISYKDDWKYVREIDQEILSWGK